jgi:hypothetical protein
LVGKLVHNRPDRHDADGLGQVLRFPRRPDKAPLHVVPTDDPQLEDSPLKPDADFAEYEQARDDVDVNYRQRALMNAIALVVVTLLVGAGVWIADTIADIQRDQDCVIQGRFNCAPIELPLKRQ